MVVLFTMYRKTCKLPFRVKGFSHSMLLNNTICHEYLFESRFLCILFMLILSVLLILQVGSSGSKLFELPNNIDCRAGFWCFKR